MAENPKAPQDGQPSIRSEAAIFGTILLLLAAGLGLLALIGAPGPGVFLVLTVGATMLGRTIHVLKWSFSRNVDPVQASRVRALTYVAVIAFICIVCLIDTLSR